MKKERRHYDREFKLMAVELVYKGQTTREVADGLGIAPDLVRRWKREYEKYNENGFSGQGNANLTDEQREIARLRKELKDAQDERDILKKAGRKIYEFIKANKELFSVGKMCNALRVSTSSYYHWLKGKPSRLTLENAQIAKAIQSIYDDSNRRYGSPKITVELLSRGRKVSRPRVARIMRSMGLRSIVKKRFRGSTTNSKHSLPVSANLLKRDFTAREPGLKWVSDLTYISTSNGWVYLTVILDLFDRRVVGWSVSRTMTTSDTVLAAWKRKD